MIKKRQREGELASVIRSLEEDMRGLSESSRETVANIVMKRLKAIKAGIAKGLCASALLNMILGGS